MKKIKSIFLVAFVVVMVAVCLGNKGKAVDDGVVVIDPVPMPYSTSSSSDSNVPTEPEIETPDNPIPDAL
ncbi:hypothetical protein KHQ81_13135 [Mycoplasmatota bacterium]|nr:hypothetical protein KHQ81_13135 [Mycoplasmatota bacterium]